MENGSPSRRSWADEADKELLSPWSLGAGSPGLYSNAFLGGGRGGRVSFSDSEDYSDSEPPSLWQCGRLGRARLSQWRTVAAGGRVANVAAGGPLGALWLRPGVPTPSWCLLPEPAPHIARHPLWRILPALSRSRTLMASTRSVLVGASAAVRRPSRQGLFLLSWWDYASIAWRAIMSRRTASSQRDASTIDVRVTAPSPARSPCGLWVPSGDARRRGRWGAVVSLHGGLRLGAGEPATPPMTPLLRGLPPRAGRRRSRG